MGRSLLKRVLSGTTAMLMLATSVSIPNISAAEPVVNITGSNTIDDVVLLVGEPLNGENPLIYHGEDIEATTQWYSDNFALGIASQFSVFMKDSFVPQNSDVEGRVAIGGYIERGQYNKSNYYAIGKGDYKDGTALGTLLNSKNYARIIWGGGLSSSGNGLWQIDFPSPNAAVAFDKNDDSAYNYVFRAYSSYTTNFYPTDGNLIDFDEQFSMLESRSEQIAEISNQFELVEEDCFTLDMREADANDQKLPNAVQCDVNFVTLKYTGNPLKATETVYLNLDDPYFKTNYITDSHGEEVTYYEYIKHANVIRYENIPKLSKAKYRILNDTKGKPVQWEYSYIVVNDGEPGTVTAGWQSNQGATKTWAFQQYTTIKGVDENGAPEAKATNISSYTDAPWLQMLNDPDLGLVEGGYPLQNSDGTDFKTGPKDTWNNNDVGASSILLNFPNADKVVVVSNMQGTILAPKAEITDAKHLKLLGSADEIREWNWVIGTMKVEPPTQSNPTVKVYTDEYGNPHISGAVVGRSFVGNIEFGFRPFTGPVRITPVSAEYRIGIMKYNEKYDPEKPDENLLSGATFGLFQAKTKSYSDPDGNTYIGFDYDADGNVKYDDQAFQEMTTSTDTEDFINLESGYYMLKEIAAPDGYAVDDRAYYIAVSEENHTVNLKTPVSQKEKSVTLPEVRITVCKYPDFSDMDDDPIADYYYSAFRADQRTYINSAGQEIKITPFENAGSIIQGIQSVKVDGVTVTDNATL